MRAATALIVGIAVGSVATTAVAAAGSPAGASVQWVRATFGDVGFDDWAWAQVEAINTAAITTGCQQVPFRRFCPAAAVTRAQMAAFLERGLHPPGWTPPGATGTVFSDVAAGHWAAAWIEHLAADGITRGCGGGRFCPEQGTTRAEMAAFLLRARHGGAWAPPAPRGTVFTDVPAGHWAAGWIEALAAEGITQGCGGGMFCPENGTTRAEMAVFLVRTFGLTPATPPTAPAIGPCLVQPADNVWNARIDGLPVDARSDAYIATIGASVGLHPDFGSGTWDGGPIGIPFVTVWGDQPGVSIAFDYADESDPGPYPIPPDAPIEGGPGSSGDRHVLVLDRDRCELWETWSSWPQADGSWQAGSGAKFPLTSNALRPAGWTSADAAGLPILPGLVRYDEVAAGVIRHALRFTASRTRQAYVWPARHYASSSTDPARPPMGQRFRLKASFDTTVFAQPVRVVLEALKSYGLILADNGSNWFLSGVPDERWDNDVLRALAQVHGHDLEAVDVSSLTVDPDSGQVAP